MCCACAVFRAVREALVSWDHSADYPLPKSKDWTAAGGSAGFTKTYKLGEEHSFLADHVVDGRILMPVSLSGTCLLEYEFVPLLCSTWLTICHWCASLLSAHSSAQPHPTHLRLQDLEGFWC